jgi:hypothetical protein
LFWFLCPSADKGGKEGARQSIEVSYRYNIPGVIQNVICIFGDIWIAFLLLLEIFLYKKIKNRK